MCKNKRRLFKLKVKKNGNILALMTVTVVVAIGGLTLTKQVVNSVSSYTGVRNTMVSKYNRDTTIKLLEGFISNYLENKTQVFNYQLTKTGRFTIIAGVNREYIFEDLNWLESGKDTYRLQSFEEQLKYYINYLGFDNVRDLSIELQPNVPLKDTLLWERLLSFDYNFALILDGDFGVKQLSVPDLQINLVIKEKGSNLKCKLKVSGIVAVRTLDSVESDYIQSHLDIDTSNMKVTYIEYSRE